MRKLLLITLGGLLLLLLLGAVFFWAGLRQLRDPASAASNEFTASFVDKCVVAGQHSDRTQQSSADEVVDNMTELCQCAAENMREDLADAGLSGFAHIVLVEGFDAKMQRVMDGCQATPSAP
ncbi:MAG TPA: hypothetical protein VF920_10170 [Dongiaceae bacterium]